MDSKCCLVTRMQLVPRCCMVMLLAFSAASCSHAQVNVGGASDDATTQVARTSRGDEAAVRDTVRRFFSARASNDRESLTELLSPSLKSAKIERLLRDSKGQGEASAGVSKVVVCGDYAIAITNLFKVRPFPEKPEWEMVCVLRLKRNLDHWLVDRMERVPAHQDDGLIEDFEDWAVRESEGKNVNSAARNSVQVDCLSTCSAAN